MIDADAVAVHLNFLQECIQPEGERLGLGVIDAIRSASQAGVPIIVKETGCGICREDALALMDAGCRIIDVGGVGGTSFAGVEAYRAEEEGDIDTFQLGRSFWDWGIPTPVSVVECASAGVEVISSGGVRSGIDVAKSLALGASMAGVALPMLSPATKSAYEVKKLLHIYIRALEISMFLTGRRCISELRCAPIIVGGEVRVILEERGFDTKKFAKEREMAR
jgi:isopentenyl-diphosphate delta-isomerase